MAGAALDRIIGGENLLILAPNPGDETAYCGTLIARCCRQGRVPYLMVLADGSSAAAHGEDAAAVAAARERATRAAAAAWGLERDRVLMAGLFDGTVPASGPVFEALVRAVLLVMWARDCTMICAPRGGICAPRGGICAPAGGGAPHHAEAAAVAREVVARSGVGWLGFDGEGFAVLAGAA